MRPRRSHDILRDAAKVNEAKNAEYDRGYIKHGAAMAALFPNGIALGGPEDFARFAVFNLMMVKMVRYAANFSQGHADSTLDLSVYSAILGEIDESLSHGVNPWSGESDPREP